MEVYRRLRNSCRFLLGNLSGFEENQRLPYDQLSYIDKDILNKYYHLYTTILRSYDQYEFYNVYINLVIHYLLVILHSPVLWFETCPQATLILSKTDSMYVFVLHLISRRSHQQVHSCFLQKLYDSCFFLSTSPYLTSWINSHCYLHQSCLSFLKRSTNLPIRTPSVLSLWTLITPCQVNGTTNKLVIFQVRFWYSKRNK